MVRYENSSVKTAPQGSGAGGLSYFEIAILFKIGKKLDNKNFGVDTTPQGPGGRRCKLFPGGVYGSYERNAHIHFIYSFDAHISSFDWK